MVEFDGKVEVTGPGGPVPFLDVFQGRDELVVYKHMWWDGAPHQGQCEGCTVTAWHLRSPGNDALRPGRGLAGQPGRLARGARPVLVLALGCGRERQLGSEHRPVPQWTRPGATPVETLGRPGHHH
jgi:Bacterial protein of unknown function (DUF899)